MADEEDPARTRVAQRRAREAAAVVEVATPEVGKETLVHAAPGVRDASSLDPGKVTRVLAENPRPETKQQAAVRRAVSNLKQGVDGLRSDVTAALEAGRSAVSLLTRTDPDTIVEAVRELRDGDGSPIVQKVIAMATGAIERALAAKEGAKPKDVPAKPAASPIDRRATFDRINKPVPPIAQTLRNHFSGPRTATPKPSPKK